MLEPILLSLRIASIATVFSFLSGRFFGLHIKQKNVPGKNFWKRSLPCP